MKYIETYFRIQSAYNNGWESEESKRRFLSEVHSLLRESGWEIQKGRSSGSSDSAIRGKEELYLHPMSFSGVIKESSISEIQQVLSKGISFRCYHIDTYKSYYEMTDAEYLLRLREMQEKMVADFLSLYKTKRSNLFITADVMDRMEKKYRIHRVGETREDPILIGILRNVFSTLVYRGDLIEGHTKKGVGYRTATKKDKKGRRIA